MAERNPGIDLFRCLLVFGICAYHAFFCCGHANGFESRLWTWAVPGFAFVSGYFGVRLKWGKVFRLLALSAVCALVPMALGGSYRESLLGYWYVYAYVLLMILSPFINAALDSLHEKGTCAPLIGVCVLAIWSWGTEFWLTRRFLPAVAGMGALTFTSLFVAYVLAWFYKESPFIREKARVWMLFPLLPLMALAGHYTSPFTLAFVVVCFACFERLKLSRMVGVAANRIAMAGLVVYLLHANWPVLGLMRGMIERMLTFSWMPRYGALLLTAFLVFCMGIGVYWIARFILDLGVRAKRSVWR